MNMNNSFTEFAKPFIDAAKKVFETMIFTKLEPQKPFLKTDNLSRGDVSAVLGLTGEIKKGDKKTDFKAMFVMSWPYECYVKTANAMLCENHTQYSKEIGDVGGEISNMIVGNAKRDLAAMGYISNMSIPSMIEGQGHSITYPQGTTIIVIPIQSAHGQLYMELCYKEG